METVFLQTTGDRHVQIVGGLTALERRVREVAKQGAKRAIVAAAPVELPRPLPIPLEFVPPGTAAPEGVRVERADVIAGVELEGDEASRQRAEWALIRGMNKSYEGPVDALINWRFSMRITRWLARRSMKVTPNHVTVGAILIGIAAALIASRGGWAMIAVAGVMLEINSILDSVDGELARLRYQYSKVGQALDNLADDIVDNVFILGVGWALGGVWWWLALGAACARWFVSLTIYLAVWRKLGNADVMAYRWWFESDVATVDEQFDPKAITTWLRSLGRRDTYVFLWMLACLAALPYWVVCHGLVIAATNMSLFLAQSTVFRAKAWVRRS
ncbi:MAG: CDP-alcohol phosphatidyltransferase family protein [Deltaproteobacteria bacterium]|nr:CDP-alcohol phosphatidyltransferase family protein [Deltaproteobacteria bacterium]